MRFDNIEEFELGDLDLDEGNYRFRRAANQKDCVKKIFLTNQPYFKGLMKSIAEDDLGEPLLVYRKGKDNIVADGNRRLSALKVLFDDDFAPSKSLQKYAAALRDQYGLKEKKIQAQVSNDKKLISRTVYERHSVGKNGTSRIPWNAYAAARFGYDNREGDHKEWYIMALLSKTEEARPSLTSFLDSSEFSYEVFRRLCRAAIRKLVISENIFSARGENIKKTARKDIVKDAVEKTHQFLIAMKRKEISLSRSESGIYADKEAAEAFVEKFGLSPDNQEVEDAKNSAANNGDENESDASGNSDSGESNTDGPHQPDDENTSGNDDQDNFEKDGQDKESDDEKSSGNGIDESAAILAKLKELKSKKLSGLYRSLCYVSLVQHPVLMYVGAWSFFEVLARLLGNTTYEFPAYYRNKMHSLGIDKTTGKDCGNALDIISKYGNSAKHSKNAAPISAIQLKNDFEVLEPLIVAALDKAIIEKK